ncbi:hypothetical protein C8R44DRAFT_730567 [Mycena epipterygia]|nr:hypothetical protein C8R44DRAFT_730567 [Mycena epipterygia]
MASVSDLHTRIEELSLDITRQKEVLRELEQKRSDARSELNAVLDPMARLPLEVSSDIFTHCLPSAPQHPDPSAAPMIFLSVCHLWSRIALATPSLWTAIRADLPRVGKQFDKLFEIWLNRARQLPLSISLHASLDSNPGLLTMLLHRSVQIQSLVLYIASGDELKQMVTPFPSLKTLTIGAHDTGEVYSDDPSECVEMLRAAPELVECTITGIYYRSGLPDADSMFTHPRLKHLIIENSGCIILLYLVLPTLESLSISHMISRDEFLAFLTRSLPPLQSLSILVPYHESWSGLVQSLPRLVPMLTDLSLSGNFETPDLFLAALAGSPQDFFPHLRTLEVHGSSAFTFDRPQWEKLVSTLSARFASRQSKIHTFRLILMNVNKKPDADITVALRQLVADGLEIHIGMRSIWTFARIWYLLLKHDSFGLGKNVSRTRKTFSRTPSVMPHFKHARRTSAQRPLRFWDMHLRKTSSDYTPRFQHDVRPAGIPNARIGILNENLPDVYQFEHDMLQDSSAKEFIEKADWNKMTWKGIVRSPPSAAMNRGNKCLRLGDLEHTHWKYEPRVMRDVYAEWRAAIDAASRRCFFMPDIHLPEPWTCNWAVWHGWNWRIPLLDQVGRWFNLADPTPSCSERCFPVDI